MVGQLVLASASPRRRQLLDQLGVQYRVDPAEIVETQLPGESPAAYVQRMAVEKARRVAARHRETGLAVLAADTTVHLDDRALGKPRDHFDGLAILALLSGRSHSVLTAVCLHGPAGNDVVLVETQVEFIQLTRELCEAYLATEEPWDKAGGYAIQGLAGAFVRRIEGSYSNVVGLPLSETRELLVAHGIATALDPAPA
ncbi:MAG: septum formation inhibitor Maf [Pseudomonadales bacterium]|nr:septum formation inhibitor Maf [Pseudomonadales bacterium]